MIVLKRMMTTLAIYFLVTTKVMTQKIKISFRTQILEPKETPSSKAAQSKITFSGSERK